MAKLSKEEQVKIVQAIPEKMLNQLADHLASLSGSGKMSGGDFWSEAWSWLKTNVGPVVLEVGKTVLNDVLIPALKQKVAAKMSGKGLKVSGSGLHTAGAGLKLAGKGSRPAKGSQEAKDKMAKVRAMRKK